MKIQTINSEDRQILLELARRSIESASRKRTSPKIRLEDYSPRLQQHAASFVTLTIQEALRGCIGSLQAFQPLVLDVVEHASAAAVEDYRFSPISPSEVQMISIEISVLTHPEVLIYSDTEDLKSKLRPGIDGVILKDGRMRATFLPQVWQQLPENDDFLSHLCAKMGAPNDHWKNKNLEVWTYQVEEFHD
jgi:hypothetical protein